MQSKDCANSYIVRNIYAYTYMVNKGAWSENTHSTRYYNIILHACAYNNSDSEETPWPREVESTKKVVDFLNK